MGEALGAAVGEADGEALGTGEGLGVGSEEELSLPPQAERETSRARAAGKRKHRRKFFNFDPSFCQRKFCRNKPAYSIRIP